MKHLLLIILTIIGFNSIVNAQNFDVDLDKISQKKLKKSLLKTKLFLVKNLNTLVPTCPGIDDSTYSHHVYTTYIDAPIDSVWKAYNTLNPSKVWDVKSIKFGFGYARNSGDILYKDDEFDHLEEGLIQFLSLRFLGGILKLNIAHELIGIDEERKRLQFCYMRYGKSEGTQIITMEAENGKTKIIHDTYYKSNSKFRDKRLYPYFHQKTVAELHANVQQLLIGES